MNTSQTVQPNRTRTPDECVGITVNQLMFTHRISRRELGDVLGITGQTMGRKLRGEIGWSLIDLFTVADFFDIPLEDLLPRRIQLPDAENAKTPSQMRGGNQNVVAGAGFEPTTSGL